jgi:dTDP-4-amino-4,6-dideoxygalactose transaminase
MMRKRIYLSPPSMGGNEMNYIQEAFDTNWIAPLGANVDGFENEMCDYLHTKHALAMVSGTSAIHMALRHIGVSDGDTVFCSSFTFAASCNPIIYQNATPVFIDSEPSSWNMSPAALEKAFAKHKPKAVIIVNLYGQSADYDKLKEICDRYKTPIIEDAAESLGATYKGKKSGTIGDYGVLSFNSNKIITASGGGMLLCPDEKSRTTIHKWITQSRDEARHYEHSELGYNYRLSNICAGIGRGQLQTMNVKLKRKREIFECYQNAFSDINEIEMMPICGYSEPNYWLSCITLKNGDPNKIIDALEAENIEPRPIWKPMHQQPFYKGYDYFPHDADVSANIFKHGLCLPSGVDMDENDMYRIISIIKGFF